MISELPPTGLELIGGRPTWGQAATDNPMRAVTRAAAFEPDGWTPQRRAEVVSLFDSLAPEWNERDVPERKVTIVDALERGLAAAPEARRSVAIELGGGTGLNRSTLASRFETLITIDISPEMLALVPDGTIPVLGDGSRLALPDGSVDALLLINMFLFPAEADRVVSPDGVVVWVSSRGPETPIYLAADEVDRALPGDWDGVAATAGYGTWSVHWRRST